jgi:hypothetical protein
MEQCTSIFCKVLESKKEIATYMTKCFPQNYTFD